MDFETGHFSHRWHHHALGHHLDRAGAPTDHSHDDLGRMGVVLSAGAGGLALVPRWGAGLGATGAALAFPATETALASLLWAAYPRDEKPPRGRGGDRQPSDGAWRR